MNFKNKPDIFIFNSEQKEEFVIQVENTLFLNIQPFVTKRKFNSFSKIQLQCNDKNNHSVKIYKNNN